MNDTKKTAVIISSTFAVIIITLLALIPLEKKNQLYAEWGRVAELAETDQRAKYIIENEQLYPEKLISYLRSSPENDLDFIYNYPFHKDDYKTMSYTDEELDGRVPALYMYDYRWCYQELNGNYPIKTNGCEAVSLTIAYIYLTGKSDLDPFKVYMKAVDMDGIAVWGGLDNDITIDLIHSIGLNVVEYSFAGENRQKIGHADIQTMKSVLDSGHIIMAGMVGDTFGSHALIIRGYEGDSFYINDPANEEKSSRLWSFDELEPEMYFMWDLYV